MEGAPVIDIEPPAPATHRMRFRTAIVPILVFAFALRLLVRGLTNHASLWIDGYNQYFAISRAMALGYGYAYLDGTPTGSRVPLYSLFLLATTQGERHFWPLVIAQALISTGTVACAAAIAYRLFGRNAALIAALVTAIYPYYVWHDTALQETGLLTFLTALAMLLLLVTRERRSLKAAAGAGALLGLAILTRSTLLPFSLFAIVWLALPDEAGSTLARRGRTALICFGSILLVLSPWLICQHAVVGRWTLGTEFGRVLFVGNNPQTFSSYPEGSIDVSQKRALNALGGDEGLSPREMHLEEVASSDRLLAKGIDYIRADPGRFIVDGIRKNVAGFGPMPSPRHHGMADLVLALSYGPILLLGLTGAWLDRRNWRRDSLFYAQFVLFAAISALIWAHSSHRTFLDIYLIVFVSSLAIRWKPAWLWRPLERWGALAPQ